MPTDTATDLVSALAAARAGYACRNPLSAARHEQAKRTMPGGNTRTVLHTDPFPIAFARASGSILVSLDGDEYVDLLGEFTAGIYGHSHPVLLTAIRQALDDGISFGGANRYEAQLAELITERFPSIELVRFTNSGTEANLLALSTAIAVTGRRAIVVFRGGYHGSVFGFDGQHDDLNAPFDFHVLPYDDVEAARAAIRELGAELAAVLVEPMQGSGGCFPASQAFLEALREETTAVGALLVFDEVMTSRLAPGGLQESTGVLPDLTALGKYLGGGLSFGAFGGSAEVMARFDPSRPDALAHAGTFNNNVLSMAAGSAGLRDVYTAQAAIALNARGDALRDRLNAAFASQDAPFTATGIGSMIHIHAARGPLRGPADLALVDPVAQELLFQRLVEQGYWIARRGFIALSLAVTDDQLDGFADAIDRIAATWPR